MPIYLLSVMLMSALRALVKNPIKESFDITFMGNEKSCQNINCFFFFSNSMFWQLLWEFAHFCSAIRTKIDPITYEQLSIMLQSEEQAMAKNFDNLSHSLAMYAYGNKHSNNS